jgi:hypothetical protein
MKSIENPEITAAVSLIDKGGLQTLSNIGKFSKFKSIVVAIVYRGRQCITQRHKKPKHLQKPWILPQSS